MPTIRQVQWVATLPSTSPLGVMDMGSTARKFAQALWSLAVTKAVVLAIKDANHEDKIANHIDADL
jgi:hypothetical protein